MVSGTFTKLAPVLGQGLNFLYIDVFGKLMAATGNPIVAHAGGVAAQTATLPGVKDYVRLDSVYHQPDYGQNNWSDCRYT